MDPVSVVLFIVVGIVTVFVVWQLRDLEKDIAEVQRLLPEVMAKAIETDPRVIALEIENQTLKADIAEIKAARRGDRQPPRAGSFRAFKNQIKGTELEQ